MFYPPCRRYLRQNHAVPRRRCPRPVSRRRADYRRRPLGAVDCQPCALLVAHRLRWNDFLFALPLALAHDRVSGSFGNSRSGDLAKGSEIRGFGGILPRGYALLEIRRTAFSRSSFYVLAPGSLSNRCGLSSCFPGPWRECAPHTRFPVALSSRGCPSSFLSRKR